jgi:lipopolysaccharide/colanic/teichoic acid biosynthesis glycosyltransferase
MSKRLFDIVLSLSGLAICVPLFIAIAFWIRIDSRGPVFFRQERTGLRGKLFNIHKFRTMVMDAEAQGPKLTVGQDFRITRSGHFLRKYKLDELPQLIDVLIGNMSLVGPRPEVPKYVAHYPAELRDLVLSVRPGITDFASIEFRNESALLERVADPEREYIQNILPVKLAYCRKYVEQQSLWIDMEIIGKTIARIWFADRL